MEMIIRDMKNQEVTKRYFCKMGLCFAIFLNAGCATVILDNDAVLRQPAPDSAQLTAPVCVKLKYQTDSIDMFNNPEGIKEMSELHQLKYSNKLSYYNINLNCDNPVAELTVRVSNLTRNWWARGVWAFGTAVTLGIIPFYVKSTGKISILEGDRILAESDFEEKRLTSIFAIPKWIMDNNRTMDQYKSEVQQATVTRKEALLLRSALEQMGKLNKVNP
jgi:hypothetical protein